ncbi:hypothetical protein ERJ75_000241500 [Trypanosoma vivax]|uniref:Uncharacterized protein n=1 Tax=Trypanosoma vivax (strain Y486) TaxID=1055687 RepID=G0TY15_TRYVY|nr:hypothetical protein TRVL_01661 [Trypanosoma vivax]KAH8618838.1 hypothetical protein ERJ75_000241500 [Trypanosoma vivax]CCC48860.1 conserved hypothetical protein [Trypanosoma vivax Y486]
MNSESKLGHEGHNIRYRRGRRNIQKRERRTTSEQNADDSEILNPVNGAVEDSTNTTEDNMLVYAQEQEFLQWIEMGNAFDISCIVRDVVSQFSAQETILAGGRVAQRLATSQGQRVCNAFPLADAVGAAEKYLTHCHGYVDAYTTKARSTIENAKCVMEASKKRVCNTRNALLKRAMRCLKTAKTLRNKMGDLVETGKPHLAELGKTGKRAVTERDAHLLLTAAAQATACLIFVVRLSTNEACKNTRVRSTVESLQGSSCARLTSTLLKNFDMASVESLPVVGPRLADVATTFLQEVRDYSWNQERRTQAMTAR